MWREDRPCGDSRPQLSRRAKPASESTVISRVGPAIAPPGELFFSHMSESKKHRRLGKVEARKRNSVPLENPRDEVTFWHSLMTIANKVGPLVWGLWLLGFAATVIFLILQDKEGKRELAAVLLVSFFVFGPIFAGIAWATRRALKNIQ